MAGRYLGALIYDILVLAALCFGATAVLLILRQGKPIMPGAHWYQGLLLLLCYFYYLYSFLQGGQTIGLKAWGLRIQIPEYSSALGAIHRRWFWFLFAFALSNWNSQDRKGFFLARRAAILYRT